MPRGIVGLPPSGLLPPVPRNIGSPVRPKPSIPCATDGGAPAGAPASAPGGAPGDYGIADLSDGLNGKTIRPLPTQGYDEYGEGAPALHRDDGTFTADWRQEFRHDGKSHDESRENICKEHPEERWCKMFLRY